MINLSKIFKDDDEDSKTVMLPLLPLRDIVVFPHMVVPLFVGRDKSIAALDDAMAKNKKILLSGYVIGRRILGKKDMLQENSQTMERSCATLKSIHLSQKTLN